MFQKWHGRYKGRESRGFPIFSPLEKVAVMHKKRATGKPLRIAQNLEFTCLLEHKALHTAIARQFGNENRNVRQEQVL